jgi:hypothetical protein
MCVNDDILSLNLPLLILSERSERSMTYASSRIMSAANDTPTPFLFFYTQSVTRRVLEKRQIIFSPFLTPIGPVFWYQDVHNI